MPARPTQPVQFNPAKLRVMVADDHDYMRTIIGEVLRGAGIREIVSVSNAYDALDEIDKIRPDLLITDWGMDGMDGNELARAIRTGHKETREIPIIMMSGDSRRRQLELARESGIDEFIAKPVSSYSVLSRVRQLIRRPRIFIDAGKYIGPCRRRARFDENSPLRRLNDPIPVLPENGAEQQKLAADYVSHAALTAEDLDPTDRAKLFSIYKDAQDAIAAALSSDDHHLTRAVRSLHRYLEGVGASGQMQGDVVGTHLDAIHKIIALPIDRTNDREMLTKGLEAVVTKKLRAA